jgi:hypothetical protein
MVELFLMKLQGTLALAAFFYDLHPKVPALSLEGLFAQFSNLQVFTTF